ncbi:MAG: hypothetical protein ACREU2_09220 [Steroidobacteraceae bacterium]
MKSYPSTVMRSGGRAILLLAVALLALAPPALRAQTDGGNRPFVGFWKLNLQKSKMHFRPGASQGGFALYRQYEDRGGGWMFHNVTTVTPKGADFLFTAARYDGKQYPVYSRETLGKFLQDGTKAPRTVEFDRVNAHVIRWTDRVGGNIVAGGTCTVSADGNTLTITNTVPGRKGQRMAAQVYDRQQ